MSTESSFSILYLLIHPFRYFMDSVHLFLFPLCFPATARLSGAHSACPVPIIDGGFLIEINLKFKMIIISMTIILHMTTHHSSETH
ncbi:hypothetical protein BP00DRAFT_265458 [Aspergillus indologenus CBS 114.80]|uniref:Uncharacterized protein n=1 Tax=Aspergillus indologenus CBS 114.80 TaxID=1450541 RepID=A0A2V5ILI0_9EURO|nr:hypothetical protein BP00DRAFT_265458 [Aspergillus indologenus CBS 114.80]